MSTLLELVTELAKGRKGLERFEAIIDPEIKKLREQIEILQQPATQQKNIIRELEDQVRIEAVAQHSQTGETKYDGVTVKHFETVTITDEKEAKKWASLNIPDMLTLKPAFGSKVKGLDLKFYNVYDDYRAQIDTDLSRFIKEEENK